MATIKVTKEFKYMFCQECGKELNEKAIVCIHCGVAVSNGRVASVDLPKPGFSDGFWTGSFIATIIIPLYGLVLGLFCLFNNKDKNKGVKMMGVALAAWIFWILFFVAIGG